MEFSKLDLHVFEVLHCPIDDFSFELIWLDNVVSMLDSHEIIVPMSLEKMLKKLIKISNHWHVFFVRLRHFSHYFHFKSISCNFTIFCSLLFFLLPTLNWVWQQQRGFFQAEHHLISVSTAVHVDPMVSLLLWSVDSKNRRSRYVFAPTGSNSRVLFWKQLTIFSQLLLRKTMKKACVVKARARARPRWSRSQNKSSLISLQNLLENIETKGASEICK